MVYKWYAKYFPKDKKGLLTLRRNTTFEECWQNLILNAGMEMDELIFKDNPNSDIRDKIFHELARRNNQSYNYIYQIWVGNIL